MGDDVFGKREKLLFKEIVKNNFSFLIKEYKFKCIESNLYCVKYVSDKTYISIFHGKASYEMELDIGLLPARIDGLSANIFEIINYDEVDSFLKLCYSATTKQAIEKFIIESARIIKTNAKKLLTGNCKYFSELKSKAIEDNERAYQALMLEQNERNTQ